MRTIPSSLSSSRHSSLAPIPAVHRGSRGAIMMTNLDTHTHPIPPPPLFGLIWFVPTPSYDPPTPHFTIVRRDIQEKYVLTSLHSVFTSGFEYDVHRLSQLFNDDNT